MTGSALTDLSAQITKATTVETSAEALISGISDRITAAVSEALANGATADELKPVSDLGAALDAESDKLQAAVNANTPGGPKAT